MGINGLLVDGGRPVPKPPVEIADPLVPGNPSEVPEDTGNGGKELYEVSVFVSFRNTKFYVGSHVECMRQS